MVMNRQEIRDIQLTLQACGYEFDPRNNGEVFPEMMRAMARMAERIQTLEQAIKALDNITDAHRDAIAKYLGEINNDTGN